MRLIENEPLIVSITLKLNDLISKMREDESVSCQLSCETLLNWETYSFGRGSQEKVDALESSALTLSYLGF